MNRLLLQLFSLKSDYIIMRYNTGCICGGGFGSIMGSFIMGDTIKNIENGNDNIYSHSTHKNKFTTLDRCMSYSIGIFVFGSISSIILGTVFALSVVSVPTATSYFIYKSNRSKINIK